LIDPVNVGIALPNWRLVDVDGEMTTSIDIRQWHINNVSTLGDGSGMLLPSVATLYAYDGATSTGDTLGELRLLRLSGNSFDGAGLSALRAAGLLAAAAQESVIPEPTTGLLATAALLCLIRRRQNR
jgi:hypothetical protein